MNEVLDGVRATAVLEAAAEGEEFAERSEQPGYFLVREDFARQYCNLEAFEKRQSDRSDEARRANDGLMANYPTASRRFLVQRFKNGAMQVLSEHLVAIDEKRHLVVLGPVPVSGRFKQEEVRAARRLMLAIAQVDPRLGDCQVIALTTHASRHWGDHEILERMGYAEVDGLTREGIGWLAAATKGADVRLFYQLDDHQLAAGATTRSARLSDIKALGVSGSAEVVTRRKFSFRFWGSQW
jgi:hypothetical protein